MRALLYFLFFALATAACSGEPVHPVGKRSWEFQSGEGSVVLEVTSVPSTLDHQPVYSVQIIRRGAAPPVTDEADFLRTVVANMDHEGMRPARISFIKLELGEPDVSHRLAAAALDSDAWRNAKPADHGRVIAQLLNSVGAYEAFDTVLAPYGLSTNVNHAEYISTSTPEKLGLHKGSIPSVPVGATLEIGLRKISKK